MIAEDDTPIRLILYHVCRQNFLDENLNQRAARYGNDAVVARHQLIGMDEADFRHGV